MNISGTTRVFLILGDPVGQVRAPEAFNHLFDKHGADAVLVPAHVPPTEFSGFVKQVLKARNIEGLWLAIPHKTAMVKLLDHCDRLGRSAEAVNAVRRNADGTLEGALFDGVGFTKALDHFGIAIPGRRMLVVGVGGGGVAIATSLAARGAGHIALYDTAKARTREIARRLGGEFGVSVVCVDTPDPAGYDLVVNATPLGLKAGDPLPFDVARLDAGTVVFDILMKNQPTPLLRACQARNIVAHPGFEMMVQQVPEYLSFFGFDSIAQAVQADPSDVRALFSTH
jgi:shikimate dehydrogenase